MNDLLYMVLKVPFNLLKNFTGFQIWADTFARHNEKFSEVLVKRPVPAWLHLGAIRELGLCRPNWIFPLDTFIAIAGNFGALPLAAWFCLRRNSRTILTKEPLWLLVALGYGALAFLLGTCTGALVFRLVGYGWPCFWIATLVLLSRYLPLEGRKAGVFLCLHMFIAWAPLMMTVIPFQGLTSHAATAVVLLMLQVCVYRFLNGLPTLSRVLHEEQGTNQSA